MAAKHIPDTYTAVTPYLIVKGAAKALDYYKQAAAKGIKAAGENIKRLSAATSG